MPEATQGLPEIPAAQNVQISPFEMPFQPVNYQDYLHFSGQQFNQMLGQQNQLWGAQLMAMRPFAEAFSELNTELAPAYAQTMVNVEKEFAPQMAQLYQSLMQGANPQFMPLYNELGSQLLGNLQQGMNMGPELTHEVEQGIRAAQTARGNWMGNAPTAQEAFGRGSAALALYNQRLGQAQNFLNSKQPSDMWGNIRATTQTYQPAPISVPQTQWMNPTVAPNVFGTVAGSQSAYNATAANAYGSYVNGLVGAAEVNNQSAFDAYNAAFDQFLYRQSVNNGLYGMPSVGGTGGGMGMMGSVLGGVGTGMMGLAASGVIGAGATAAGVGVAGAAAGAAAAICWLARKLAPENWKSFRKYLFTMATAEERQDYIYNARRIANSI